MFGLRVTVCFLMSLTELISWFSFLELKKIHDQSQQFTLTPFILKHWKQQNWNTFSGEAQTVLSRTTTPHPHPPARARLGRYQGVPKPRNKCNLFAVFWVCPGVSSLLDMPKSPPHWGVQTGHNTGVQPWQGMWTVLSPQQQGWNGP